MIIEISMHIGMHCINLHVKRNDESIDLSVTLMAVQLICLDSSSPDLSTACVLTYLAHMHVHAHHEYTRMLQLFVNFFILLQKFDT